MQLLNEARFTANETTDAWTKAFTFPFRLLLPCVYHRLTFVYFQEVSGRKFQVLNREGKAHSIPSKPRNKP